jgi:hypothetical protein
MRPARDTLGTLLFPVWVFLLSVYLIFASAPTEGRPPAEVSTAGGSCEPSTALGAVIRNNSRTTLDPVHRDEGRSPR